MSLALTVGNYLCGWGFRAQRPVRRAWEQQPAQVREWLDTGASHPHAIGILARAWCGVMWRIWYDRTTHNPDLHGGLQRLTAHQR